MAEDTDTAVRPQPATPKGFASKQAFLQDMRTKFDRAVGADQHNRDAALEDLNFIIGDQWDPLVKAERRKRRKPILTINRLPAYLAQVVNNRLVNETDIRVLPDKDGTKNLADLRQGIIKSIFKNSDADYARDEASKYQIACGVGWFHLKLEYNSDDVWSQDIKIVSVPDPMAVVIDELSTEPSGGDANYGFVVDDLPLDIFKDRYPWAAVSDFAEGFVNYRSPTQWYTDNSIKLVSYWRMIEDGEKTLALMADGTTQEIDPNAVSALLASNSIQSRPDGSPYIRTMPRRAAQMYLCSGADILEGPYTLPISSLPIFRVPGWEFRIGRRLHRWGMIRFLKDPMRLHNYWRSVIAEQLVAAPRNKWVATNDAISGHENDWRNSHLSDDPLLIYNGEGAMPTRVAVPPADPALLEQAATSVQDIRDVSNIHEAALGIKSNEVSGKAIAQRQQATDLGSYIYSDRSRIADERCAKVINELIPTVYDTQRVMKIIDKDDKPLQVMLNDPMNPNTDVTIGKYEVSVTTGPSTVTKRQLAAEQMMAFVNAAPETAGQVMDLVAEAQDWPKSNEFARRFRLALPPGVVPPDEVPPEIQQMQAQQAQKQEIIDQIELAKAQAEIANMEAQAMERQARAQSLLAGAQKAISDADARQADVEGKNLDRDMKARLEVVKTAKDVIETQQMQQKEDADNDGE